MTEGVATLPADLSLSGVLGVHSVLNISPGVGVDGRAPKVVKVHFASNTSPGSYTLGQALDLIVVFNK